MFMLEQLIFTAGPYRQASNVIKVMPCSLFQNDREMENIMAKEFWAYNWFKNGCKIIFFEDTKAL